MHSTDPDQPNQTGNPEADTTRTPVQELLNVRFSGSLVGTTAYTTTEGELMLGRLRRIEGGEFQSPGEGVVLQGGAQGIRFDPRYGAGNVPWSMWSLVAEIVFTPTAIPTGLSTILSAGRFLFVTANPPGADTPSDHGVLEYGFSLDTGQVHRKRAAFPPPNRKSFLSLRLVYNGGSVELQAVLDGVSLPAVQAEGSLADDRTALVFGIGNDVFGSSSGGGLTGVIHQVRISTGDTTPDPTGFALQAPPERAVLLEHAGHQCTPSDIEPANYIPVDSGDCEHSIIRKATLVRPSRRQMDWQEARLSAFIHFGINTFYDQEWGHGTEDPGRFQPTGEIDPDSWVKTLRDNGFRYAVLTVKHHDGFLLYPSRYSRYSVAATPWKSGRGDIVKDFTDAARKYGMKVGLYLSPADSHEERPGGTFGNGSQQQLRTIPTLVEGDDRAGGGHPAFEYQATDYGAYFLNTLYEVLTQYGQVDEVWFDGAQGNTEKEELYDYPAFYDLIARLQPQALIAVGGRDIRWVGNESGLARSSEWGPVAINDPGDGGRIAITSDGDFQELGTRASLISSVRTGRSNALHWWPTESDMKLTQGWFAHPDDVPLGPEDLMRHYDATVGRNSVMLLNVPPTISGGFAPSSISALKGFTSRRQRAFAEDYALGLPVIANGTPETVLTDGNGYTSWTLGTEEPATIEVDFGCERTVDRVSLGENVFHHGQSAESFTVEALVDNAWLGTASGGSIGYNRSVTFSPVTSSRIRITVDAMRSPVHLAKVSVYGAAPTPQPTPAEIFVDCSAPKPGPGTREHPFNTLEQFRQTEIVPGTTIYFRSGTSCPESTTSFWGYGTPEEPITVTVYDGNDEPLIGLTPLSEFFAGLSVQGWAVACGSIPA